MFQVQEQVQVQLDSICYQTVSVIFMKLEKIAQKHSNFFYTFC